LVGCGEQEIGAIDVILLRGIVDRMGPRVRGEHLEAMREALVQREVQTVVFGLPDRLCSHNVPEAWECARRGEDRPAIGQLLA
jgi:hypothetical protein